MNLLSFIGRCAASIVLFGTAIILAVAAALSKAEAGDPEGRTIPLHVFDTETGGVTVVPIARPAEHAISCYRFDDAGHIECYVATAVLRNHGVFVGWNVELQRFYGTWAEVVS